MQKYRVSYFLSNNGSTKFTKVADTGKTIDIEAVNEQMARQKVSDMFQSRITRISNIVLIK